MKRILAAFIISVTILSCNSDNTPDVSGIRISVRPERFEEDFFALDTSRLAEGLRGLTQKYPAFTHDFFSEILGLDKAVSFVSADSQLAIIKLFIKDYRPLKDSCDKVFGDFEEETREIAKGLQYVKYYFPKYKTPEKIITFIGPIDAYFETSFGTVGDIITSEGLGVGLQLHLGNNFSVYKTFAGQELYPEYISRTFTPAYVAVNCMKNIIDDIYEDKSTGRSLIEQMVEKGKRFYILDKLLPATPEYVKIGYTKKQLEDAHKNEAVIWDFFLKNELLNNQEQDVIKNYIGESPKTQELGENAPGNIGSFSGWQIVKKYMVKNPEVTLEKLLKTDAREIYTSVKYKPAR